MRNKYCKLYLLKTLAAILLTVGSVFTAVAQDTISYCGNEPYVTGIGTSGGPIWWGIRIPASLLTGHESISEVLVFVNNGSPGTYNLTLFQGGTDIPQTTIYSQNYTFTSNLNAYKSCAFSYPVAIDDTKNLWVIFQTNGIDYPASVCAYTGNPNSDLVSTNGYFTWSNLSDVSQFSNSWMIKVVTSTGSAIPISFNCSGDGQVQKTYIYDGNRCGSTDYYSEDFYASYDFLPDEGNELTHLYVNNVDRINDIYTHYSGSSGAVHTFGFNVSTANSLSSSISINPVFSPRTYLITAYSADTLMGYVIGGGEYGAGTTATLTPVPYNGFVFNRWDDNSTENPRSVIVQGNAQYVAHFVKSDGIEVADSKLNLTLYPNPTSDYTAISLSGVYGTVSLSVVDVNGRMLTSKYVVCDGNCLTYLDIKDFASGTYFVYAATLDGNFTTRKLLVK